MMKKLDFSKPVFFLKRLFKDKSGQLLGGRPTSKEEKRREEEWRKAEGRGEEERREEEREAERRPEEERATRVPYYDKRDIDRTPEELAEILKRFGVKEEEINRLSQLKKIDKIQEIESDIAARKLKWREKEAEKRKRLGEGRLPALRKKVEGWGGDAKKFLRGESAWRGEHGDWGGWMFIIMTGLLYYLDMFLGYNGINVDKFLNNIAFIGVESYIGWFFNAIVLTLLIAYWAIYQPKIPEFLSFVLVAETVSLILFLGGMGVMLIHLAFICAFYFLYIRSTAENEVAANMITFFLLAFDFFGYGILATVLNNPIVSNRLIIPMWFYFALIYTRNQERSFWIDLIIFMVIMGNVFYFVGGIDGLRNMGKPLTTEELREQRNFFATAINNVRQTFYKAYEGFRQDMEAQLEYATGGYYKGRVEKTKKEPLGVYIEELKTSEPTFYSGEKAIIWGTLKARGLEDAVIIKIICNRAKKLVQQTLGSLEEVGPEANEIIPDRPFMIYQQEYRDFECSFSTTPDSTNLDEGINTIKAGAEFGFSTLAYLRAYFMDRDRLIAMRREGLDVLKEFDVKDKEIVAVYTTGPVSIGMETTDPLIGVSKAGTGLDYTRLGVTLENVEGWEGKIKKVNELVFLIPKGLTINDPAGDCTRQFKIYGLKGEGQDVCFNSKYANDPLNAYKEGSGSCERFTLKPCIETCALNKIKKEDWEKIKDNADGIKQKINELAEGCMNQCQPNYESCVEDCYVLFEFDIDKEKKNEKPEYTAYALDLDKIETGEYENIGRFRSFSCRINVDDKVLGTTPLTLRYFRAKARYDYVIEKEVDINLEPRGLPWYYVGLKRYEIETPGGTIHLEISGEMPQRIATYAEQIGVAGDYALAMTYIESGFRHCCKDVNNVNCERDEETFECDFDKLISSGSSYGVMQLNKQQHCAWFYPTEVCVNNQKPEDCVKVDYPFDKNKPLDCKIYDEAKCEGKNARNLDCNINIGFRFLKYLHDEYGTTGISICGEHYTGWNAALRYYNGVACNDYVEKVNEIRLQIIKEGKLEESHKTKTEPTGSEQITVYYGRPNPPESVEAQPIVSASGIPSVYVKWKKPSESTDIKEYEIWRIIEEDVGMGIVPKYEEVETVQPTEFEYNDLTAQKGVTYVYCVKAINTEGEGSDCVKSNQVKQIEQPIYIS